jgi:hypothetical protein
MSIVDSVEEPGVFGAVPDASDEPKSPGGAEAKNNPIGLVGSIRHAEGR